MKNILKAIKSVLRGFDNKLNHIENQIEKSISDAVKTMTGASDTKDGKSGIVPAPKAGQQNLPLCGDGQYKMLPQADYTQNDATASNYIKNRPGGYIGEQKTYKLDISAVKQDGIDELTDVSVLQDDFMHRSSIDVEISHSSGTINRTLTQREIGPYIINEYGAQIYGNAHLISPSQPDTGEDMALYKQMDSQSSYSIGWHVWATSVPSGDVEVCVVEKTMNAVRFDSEFIPWYASPTAKSVLYTAQSLTEEQQAQARANIGAGTQYTLPQASPDALGGVKADAAETADTQPVRIGTDGKLYTAPGGGGADISLGISGATAGQMAKVKAVDASGVPTAWEAGDAASGGSEWTKLGDVTVSQTAEFVPLSFSNGIVTIDTNADGYASLPSSGTIGCIVHTIDVTSKENPVVGMLKPKNYEAGTFEFYNRDSVFQSSAAYDPTTYKISIGNVAMVVLENIPTDYKRYKSRVTTPAYTNHGLRARYTCDGFTDIGCGADSTVNMVGGAIIETEFYPHPYDENYVYRRVRTAYGKFYGGGSGNEFQSFELISSGSGKTKPQESGKISFRVLSMIFVNGTRFELWGTNDD